MEQNRNWAGNYQYSASHVFYPGNVEQVTELVLRHPHIKVLGTRHSFNGIADCSGSLLSLQKLNQVILLDIERHQVTVQAGIRYGELGRFLHEHGYALPNFASLPHISVVGAVATATHGSGDRNGILAASVYAFDVIQADGEMVTFSRELDEDKFHGAVVGLGGLGVVTTITLDVVPQFQMVQYVYDDLPFEQLKDHFDAIFSSDYSVSLFTNWKTAAFNQVWRKQKVSEGTQLDVESSFFGATLADSPRHPVPGLTGENCSEQLGVPGPSFERLPHFRMEFTPSAGEELQSEYFVPRSMAYEALCAINEMRAYISPYLHISEVRTIAADLFWMSPCYKRDSVTIHFTWKADWPAVQQVLPLIEERLAPFQARPHWGKLFTMSPDRVRALYGKLPDFQKLLLQHDPLGKFRNDYIHDYVMD